MLRILDVSYVVLRELRPYLARIEQRDRDLARQLRRACTSVQLNISEGGGLRGGNRRLKYQYALDSAEETRAALRAAEALGYIESVDEALLNRISHIIGVLVKVTR